MAKDTGEKTTDKAIDRARLRQLAVEGSRALAEDLLRAAAESDPHVPDLPEIIKLVGVPLGDASLPADPTRDWAQTRALRKVQKARATHQVHALQVIRRCIGLMRRLENISPDDARWSEVTGEIADFYAGFRHGARADRSNRRRLVLAIEQAADMALRWRVFRAMARARMKRATASDRRLLRRDQTPFLAPARTIFGVDDLSNLTPERAADFLKPKTEDEFFPEQEWAFLVSKEAHNLLLPEIAASLDTHREKVVPLLRAWTQRATRQRGGADKWTLAAELFGLIGFANVEPETLRQDVADGNAEREQRTARYRTVGVKSP